MVDGISSVVESIASGKKVKGTGAPVSVKNLIVVIKVYSVTVLQLKVLLNTANRSTVRIS